LAEYGSRAAYFLEAMAAELWKDSRIRREFHENKENLKSFLENESRVKEHKGGISRHKKPEKIENEVDRQTNVIMAKWKADPALQNEFNGDFDVYSAYESNKHRVKTM
jgi:hypothetical protein